MMHAMGWQATFPAPLDAAPRALAGLRSRAASELLERGMRSAGLEPWTPRKGPFGNPLPEAGWYVSKSHCSDHVAAALARVPVGIDVEPIRLARVATWERVMDAAEARLLGPVDALAFTRLWTAKEAVLKAHEVGIAGLSKCRLVQVLSPSCLELRYQDRRHRVHQQFVAQHVVSLCAVGQETVSWPQP
ncbi:MAG: 4'-phosphopantetheinyl transferase superfamily protein [Planctomycetes bacterium]|nr:4'-phosphopantetheinyl transferase superfamily protein [Planctomycetota bacterium]MCB9909489.1 4'-phosphopantetheinyl transferase superfamily protein [Planctomycetota bacterium]MCB9912544.1 4'-phosphopantetheinyl transferase superfamily protein [Planctomycetota bacterium]HRV80117.1 4'-phosphopantetheinyl transferase superfamily protein [Planctomycetota bacterium]